MLDWGDLDDLQQVEFRGRVFFTAHNQNVFEALVVFGAIQGLAVAHTVEFEPFQGLDHGTGVGRTCALNGVGVKQRLHVAGMRRLMDAARLMPILGATLWAVPLLWGDGGQGDAGARMSNSNAMVYIFGVWVVLVGLTMWVSLRLKDDSAEPPSTSPPRQGPPPGAAQ